MNEITGTGSAGDFDFFVGEWNGRQRRLREPLAGCDDWDEFASTTRCWSLFGGAANLDELSVPDRGFSGISLRLFDPAARNWSIYWANSRNGLLALPPVVGGFDVARNPAARDAYRFTRAVSVVGKSFKCTFKDLD
jgi:hypothetical protein